MSLADLIKQKTGNTCEKLDTQCSVDDWKETVPDDYDFDAVVDAPKEACPRCEKMILTENLKSHRDSHSSEIFENFLFLGGERNAKNLKELTTRTNIKEILCVSSESTEQFPGQFIYHNYSFKDSADQTILDHFEEISNILAKAEESKNAVLVHCVQGISRSASVVIAYCMKSRRWSLKESYEYVKEKRGVISPNTNFIGQLRDYETKLFGTPPTLTVDDVYKGEIILQVG